MEHDRRSAVALIVEADQRVRALVSKSLRSAGHRVLEAGSAGEAFAVAKAAAAEAIALLVLDVGEPGIKCVERTRKIRSRWPGLKILFLSGSGRREVAAACAGPGSGFLAKPFTPSELLDRVRTLLSA